MIVKPPFFENHVLDRGNGSIVIGKGLCGNIETEHTGMDKGCIHHQKKSQTCKEKATKT